jgi:hypothetical protein
VEGGAVVSTVENRDEVRIYDAVTCWTRIVDRETGEVLRLTSDVQEFREDDRSGK